ncbi:MAG: Trm112 family protein, partial [Longimicrobiales bacterium]
MDALWPTIAMYILLTDILTCPRCGPEFGLILLADRMEERRVLAGVLGCANCREHYPITGGYGAFGSGWPIETDAPNDDAAVRLAALLGVTEGPGFVLLVGAPATHAGALADMIPGLEVVAASDSARAWSERAGVS